VFLMVGIGLSRLSSGVGRNKRGAWRDPCRAGAALPSPRGSAGEAARNSSAAVAGIIAEIAPARAGHPAHAGAETCRPCFRRQLFRARRRRTAAWFWAEDPP